MGGTNFQFKQFAVYHNRCAMKVGTDGVLLGAWADVGRAKSVLDIGTGSGVIALMVAQRSKADVVGVEIDQEAFSQACENYACSPWSPRLKAVCADITTYTHDAAFDAILSNPPFYRNGLGAKSAQRSMARMEACLPYSQLIAATVRLLKDRGDFFVVLPFDEAEHFSYQCWEQGLQLRRRTDVCTKVGKRAKRVLLHYVKGEGADISRNTLFIQAETGDYTEMYRQLVGDFYLKM